MQGPRIVLISPKGPLYRKRGGIFGQGLRYMPQTFPTLAALIPEDMSVDLHCIDEGIENFDPETLEADLIGIWRVSPSGRWTVPARALHQKITFFTKLDIIYDEIHGLTLQTK